MVHGKYRGEIMILKAFIEIAMFLSCFTVGFIITTDCNEYDLLRACKLAFCALIFDTVTIIAASVALP